MLYRRSTCSVAWTRMVGRRWLCTTWRIDRQCHQQRAPPRDIAPLPTGAFIWARPQRLGTLRRQSWWLGL